MPQSSPQTDGANSSKASQAMLKIGQACRGALEFLAVDISGPPKSTATSPSQPPSTARPPSAPASIPRTERFNVSCRYHDTVLEFPADEPRGGHRRAPSLGTSPSRIPYALEQRGSYACDDCVTRSLLDAARSQNGTGRPDPASYHFAGEASSTSAGGAIATKPDSATGSDPETAVSTKKGKGKARQV